MFDCGWGGVEEDGGRRGKWQSGKVGVEEGEERVKGEEGERGVGSIANKLGKGDCTSLKVISFIR